MDQNIEEGIERYIKYVRRMSLLTDDELIVVLSAAFSQNPDSYIGTGIDLEGHAKHIKEMSVLSDDQMRKSLRDFAEVDPVMREIFEDAAKKKALQDTKKMAKDLQGDPRRFARKVDRELRF